ncbi:MAG: F0F1 ATP synthase subunit B, partial [Acidimicrobiales bacterium]
MIVASNFLVPNATFLVELVAFLLVLGVLAKYVLPPLNQMMDRRQATIRQGLDDAEEAKRRVAQTESEYHDAIAEARREARALVDEANRLGESLRGELRQRGEQEYERTIARASVDIEALSRRASEELRGQIAGVVVAVVEKVIGEAFDEQAQRAIIDRAIAEVEAEAAAGPAAPAAPPAPAG